MRPSLAPTEELVVPGWHAGVSISDHGWNRNLGSSLLRLGSPERRLVPGFRTLLPPLSLVPLDLHQIHLRLAMSNVLLYRAL
jgi:hypothetical protein